MISHISETRQNVKNTDDQCSCSKNRSKSKLLSRNGNILSLSKFREKKIMYKITYLERIILLLRHFSLNAEKSVKIEFNNNEQ
jgi:hypothetical protein